MAANRFYSNTAQEAALTASVTAATTTFSVDGTSGFPASTPFTMIVDPETPSEEVVTVTNVSALTLTVSRGNDNTIALSHEAGAVVIHAHTARDFSEPQDHLGATADVHGIGSGNSVVGTGAAQVLTNKDLTSGTNTFPNSLATLAGSQIVTNKDMTSDTNTFPTDVAAQPGDLKMTVKSAASSPTVLDGGWLKCDGGLVSRTTFAGLFAAIGTQHGAGDGSTTFALPDMRSRLPIGVGTFAVQGEDDGKVEANRSLSHIHPITSGGGHVHDMNTEQNAQLTTPGTGGHHPVTQNTASSGAHDHGGNTLGNTEDSLPYLAVNVLVKV